MEQLPLPEFLQEFSQRDGVRKFNYKPPDTQVDLNKIFSCLKTMNDSSPKLSGAAEGEEKNSSRKNDSN